MDNQHSPQNLSEQSPNPVHRTLIFGAPKTGKSLLAGMLAEYYNLIWIDMENGHDVLFQLPEEWRKRITLLNLPDTRSYPIAIETCLKLVKEKCEVCLTHGKVGCMVCKRKETTEKETTHTDLFLDLNLPRLNDPNTIIIWDSATQLTNSCIAHITKNEPEDYKLDWEDWGHLGKLLDIFFSHIQQSNYHTIVISHEVEAETEGKKKKIVPVSGTRNFSRNVAKYFDHVVYAEVKNMKHSFTSSTTATTNILTGSRTSASIEAYPGYGLLPIFKPEYFAPVDTAIIAKPTGLTGTPQPSKLIQPRAQQTLGKGKKPVPAKKLHNTPAPTKETTTQQPAQPVGGTQKTKDILARLKKRVHT